MIDSAFPTQVNYIYALNYTKPHPDCGLSYSLKDLRLFEVFQRSIIDK